MTTTNYRTLSNAELVRAADADPLVLVHPLFAELAARLREPKGVRPHERLAPIMREPAGVR